MVLAGGCVNVTAPDKPIVINLNISITQEVVYRLDNKAKALHPGQSGNILMRKLLPTFGLAAMLSVAMVAPASAQRDRLSGGASGRARRRAARWLSRHRRRRDAGTPRRW